MIHAFKRKLSSQCGASLLLALLFVLICITVSASILMAAVSNAGKHRSNLDEHQRYLALSSAVSLLCDELNQAEYQGQYQYEKTLHTIENPEDGTQSTITLHHFAQLDGSYHPIEAPDRAGALAPFLLSDFDALFSQEIQARLNPGDFETFSCKPDTAPSPHTLTLTPQTGTGLDEQEVKIELHVVEASYTIELTATLDDYRIQAELTPTSSKPTLPASLTVGRHQTEALRWEIGWITTGAEEAST